jgi:non-ribosomal peptide synthase protein (TIGR01720 family)
MTQSTENPLMDGIAIIGMSGHFPGARGLDAFWRNLEGGVESIRFYSDEELVSAGVPVHTLGDPNYVKARAELADIDMFDAALFGFTPREAEIADPQRRVFLECVWEALENAGCDPTRYAGDIGLYCGASMNTYLINNLLHNRRAVDAMGLLNTVIFNRNDHLATHTAYTLDLKGPAVTVQTTCSTSLVAVHMACQALIGYQCDMALAGGVSVAVPNRVGYLYEEGGIGSADGHCRAFDAAANGTVSGSGAGVVVLKRLADAIEARDTIRAVIRSSAINNDGANKIGYTAPSVDGQAQAIALAQEIAGVVPDQIGYIECHGTGTPLGDPIEMQALGQVFRRATARTGFCAIGTVKTNIGHLDAAAGIAGLIKTTLALEHRKLPPSLHFSAPNPRIDFAGSPFRVNATLSDWPAEQGTRIAGVSSFGIGGTNAHLIIEQAPAPAPRPARRQPQLLVLSARSKAALNDMVSNLAEHLLHNPQQDLGDIAYTLQVGRRALGQRCAFVCRDHDDAVSVLSMGDVGRMASGANEAASRAVTFMFPGQGAQYVNAAADLYQTEAVFRAEFDRCATGLRDHLDRPLHDLLFATPDQAAAAADRLQQTVYAQPVLFAVEYALARQLMAWGVKPQAMIGHSIGEYVAACLNGVFSLEDALRLVATRGRLMQGLPGGSMLSVALPEQELRARLSPGLEIAAVNSPSLCVVAGQSARVVEFEAGLVEQGVGCLALRTSHAFHSSMMDPILAAFTEAFDGVEMHAPSGRYISTLTGTWITAAEATSPAYWARHLREPVQFGKGVAQLFADPAWILLEVGPGRTLMSMARRHPQKAAAQLALHTLPTPDGGRSSVESALLAVGQLWTAGVEPDWEALHRQTPRARVPLPTYPFERQRYWVDPVSVGSVLSDPLQRDPEPGRWLYAPSWKRTAQGARPPAGSPPASWLLFSHAGDVSAQIAGSVERHATQVVTVHAATEFVRHGSHAFGIDPTDASHHSRLLAELQRDQLLPDRIVHAFGLQWPDPDATAPAAFYSLLYLAQALGMEAGGQTVHIDVLVANAHDVTGAEVLCPEQAMLTGPALVIPQEYAGISCRLLEVDRSETGRAEGAVLPAALLDDLQRSDAASVAYRNGYRWEQLFEHIQTDASPVPGERLRADGVYLITGGLGGMGMTLARHLADRLPGVKLALLGRRSLGDEDAANDATTEVDQGRSRMREGLRVLRESGAQVVYHAVDVADPVGLHEVVQQVTAQLGPVNGLIHTAGIAGNGLIQLKTREHADQVLAAKVAGTRALYDALSGQPLDFSILCSSRSALFGGISSVDYCAANAYLDAFAHARRRQTGDFIVSVNWPAWQGVGMLVDSAARHHLRHDAAVPAGQAVGHPLVERHVLASADRHVFHSCFAVKSHWVLDEHRILGTAVVPGATYLEMARAALAGAVGGGPVEISNVYFLTPLRVQDDDARTVRVVLDRSEEGYDFCVESASTTAVEAAQEWVRHVIGKISSIAAPPAQRQDIAALSAGFPGDGQRLNEENFYDESLGPRWQCATHVKVDEGRMLMELRLSDEFAGDLQHLHLHPALLDRAAGVGLLFLVDTGNYLPFGYGSLRLYAPFQQRMFVYSRGGADPSTDAETTVFDVDVLAEDGTVLAQISRFAHKRINEVGKAVNALMAGHQQGGDASVGNVVVVEPRSSSSDIASPFEEVLNQGISPEEGARVFDRLLSRCVPAQVVVSPNDLAAAIERARNVSLDRLSSMDAAVPALASYARPGLDTEFVAPASELERRLAQLWQDGLGIDRVGLHDDFFELGGNSVLAIQIMAIARKAGLSFSVQQLFQFPTVAQLAACLQDTGAAPSAAQERATLRLLPLQRHLLAAGTHAAAGGWTVLLEIDPNHTASVLSERLEGFLQDHDALRLQFSGSGHAVRAEVSRSADGLLEIVDVGSVAGHQRQAFIVEQAREIAAGLQADAPALVRLVLFQAGAGQSATLLVAAHPAAVDPGAAAPLLSALRMALDPLQRVAGEPENIPRYREATETLAAFAQSAVADAEFAYWRDGSDEHSVLWPARGEQTEPSRSLYSVALDDAQTRLLQTEAARAYRLRIEDCALAQLVEVLGGQTAGRPLWIDCQGRPHRLGGEDVSAVIGAFATAAPVLFSPSPGGDPAALLTRVKEQSRAAPRNGTVYELVLEMGDAAHEGAGGARLSRPSVGFAYLGDLDDALPPGAGLRLAPGAALTGIEHPHWSGYALSVRCVVQAGSLHLHWSYDPARLDRDVVAALATAHRDGMAALGRHCAKAEREVVSPSDFPLAALDADKLDRIMKMLE